MDGQINPIPTIEEMKFYEVSDYLIWAGEQDLITAVMASDDWYQTLPADRQALIDQTFAELNDFIPPVVEAFNKERLDRIKAAKPGIQTIELTEAERAVFRERSLATQAAVGEIVGARGAELLTALQAEIGG